MSTYLWDRTLARSIAGAFRTESNAGFRPGWRRFATSFPAAAVLASAAAGLMASCATLPAQRPSPAPPAAQPPSPAPPVRPPDTAIPAPARPARFDHEPAIDVSLAVDIERLTIRPQGRKRLALSGGRGETELGVTDASIQVRTVGGRWEAVWTGDGSRPLVTGFAVADTVWIEGPFQWDGKTWRGRAKVFMNPRGKLTIASRLPLETYLLGVVPAEIGGLSEELVEAGRAQAVAARSYTLFYRGRRAAEGFDLYGTVEDQVYGSVEAERPLATRCVENTRGLVALSADRPIRANYCSTCGGITADVWEAWPADPLPYLVSHRDRGGGEDFCAKSAHYRWREEWSAESFLQGIRTFGPAQGVRLPRGGMGELVDVRVASRSRSGRVWRLVVVTSTGEIDISAHQLRRVIRRSEERLLRSNLLKFGVRRDPRTRRALAVVASGAGSGHGVGLCQTGARGMALAGIDAERILRHYYRGIELERLY